MQKKAIGIDLGSSKCCVGVVVNGKVEIIENEKASKTTPSYVAFTNSVVLSGNDAKDQVVLNSKNTLHGFKKYMGIKHLGEGDITHPSLTVSDGERPCFEVLYRKEKQKIFPEQASAILLKKAKALAEGHLGCEVRDAVISIPSHFTMAQRRATKDAASVAGLNVLSFITEPTAVGVSYNYTRSLKKEEKVLVVDFGGSKLNASLLEIKADSVTVLKSSGVPFGGDDIDRIMVAKYSEVIKEMFGPDFTVLDKLLMRLQLACEQLKKSLSILPSSNIQIDNITGDEDFKTEVNKEIIDDLIHASLEQCLVKVLKEVILSEDGQKVHFDRVLLSGGSSRIPLFQMLLKRNIQKDLDKHVNLDESVACGAAIQAALLAKDNYISDVYIKDKLPFKIYKKYVNRKECNPVFDPCRINSGLKSVVQDCRDILIDQKYYEVSQDDSQIAELVMFNVGTSLDEEKLICKYDLHYIMDECGIVHIYVTIQEDREYRHLFSFPSLNDVSKMKKMQSKFEEHMKEERNLASQMNDLENLCFSVKNSPSNNNEMTEEAHNEIASLCDEIILWLDCAEDVDADSLRQKKEELESRLQKAREQKAREFSPQKDEESAKTPSVSKASLVAPSTTDQPPANHNYCLRSRSLARTSKKTADRPRSSSRYRCSTEELNEINKASANDGTRGSREPSRDRHGSFSRTRSLSRDQESSRSFGFDSSEFKQREDFSGNMESRGRPRNKYNLPPTIKEPLSTGPPNGKFREGQKYAGPFHQNPTNSVVNTAPSKDPAKPPLWTEGGAGLYPKIPIPSPSNRNVKNLANVFEPNNSSNGSSVRKRSNSRNRRQESPSRR